jgi:hydroxyacylglutathione hydrolase
MPTSIERFVTGSIQTNTYVVTKDTQACLIVDPAAGCDNVIRWIASQALVPEAIVLTHGHFDHCMGIPSVQHIYPLLPVWMHTDDIQIITRSELNGSFLIGSSYVYTGPIQPLMEGILHIGSFVSNVLHIPGHTPGGCALMFDGNCIAGDSLFAGSVGRTDFTLSDEDLLIRSIQKKLLTLPDETIVYPGHGGRTTIGRERRLNPFLQK